MTLRQMELVVHQDALKQGGDGAAHLQEGQACVYLAGWEKARYS